MISKKFNTKIDNKELIVDVNNLAERANGSVFVSFGETTLLATVTMGDHDVDMGYFPLTVSYEEKFYAGGKILGSRFTRREGKPSDHSVLNSRLIDRTIRPLFSEGIQREVQVVVTLLSWDGETDPATLGIFAASLALLISDVPWNGPVAGVRVGNNLTVFPNNETRNEMDLIVSGLEDIDGNVIFNMFEAQFGIMKEDKAVEAVSLAKKYIKDLITFQKDIQKEVGREKQVFEVKEKDTEVEELILADLKMKLKMIIFIMKLKNI
jgi:polyribonucleotide nucleotidyltransferase